MSSGGPIESGEDRSTNHGRPDTDTTGTQQGRGPQPLGPWALALGVLCVGILATVLRIGRAVYRRLRSGD